jgi:hypothetical protein
LYPDRLAQKAGDATDEHSMLETYDDATFEDTTLT